MFVNGLLTPPFVCACARTGLATRFAAPATQYLSSSSCCWSSTARQLLERPGPLRPGLLSAATAAAPAPPPRAGLAGQPALLVARSEGHPGQPLLPLHRQPVRHQAGGRAACAPVLVRAAPLGRRGLPCCGGRLRLCHSVPPPPPSGGLQSPGASLYTCPAPQPAATGPLRPAPGPSATYRWGEYQGPTCVHPSPLARRPCQCAWCQSLSQDSHHLQRNGLDGAPALMAEGSPEPPLAAFGLQTAGTRLALGGCSLVLSESLATAFWHASHSSQKHSCIHMSI